MTVLAKVSRIIAKSLPQVKESFRIKAHEAHLRHAFRCAVGGAVIAILAQTTITSGCLSNILFFISTVAGTPEPYCGFQLRSSVLTLIGAFIATGVSAAVLYTSSSPAAIFFMTVPFIVIFTALRPERELLPLPIVCNVLLGITVITHNGANEAKIGTILESLLLDAVIAFAVAVLVNMVFRDDAGRVGLAVLACELKRAGSAISSIASQLFMDESVLENRRENSAPATEDVGANDSISKEEGHSMSRTALRTILNRTASRTKSPFQGLKLNFDVSSEFDRSVPSGHTRVATYGSIARSQQLLSVSVYEPGGCGLEYLFKRNVIAKWDALLDSTRDLVTKISSVESVVVRSVDSKAHSRISRYHLKLLLGEAYFPLWISHYAATAAACSVASRFIRTFTSERHVQEFDQEIDARSKSWACRRVELYLGFLEQFRSFWRCRGRSFDEDLNGDYSNRIEQTTTPPNERPKVSQAFSNTHMRGAELRAVIFFAVSSHALSENLARVQNDIGNIAQMGLETDVLQPLRFLTLPFPTLGQRIWRVCRGRIARWEARFILAHSSMLASILAIALFVKPLSRFESSEIAWVFTSAGLSAQLSVEPTLFIGVLRVLSTIFGSFSGFAFNQALRALDRPNAQFAQAPFMAVVTLLSLSITPTQYRYAAFLFIVTNGIMSFCPKSTEKCRIVFEEVPPSCFANWRYAVTRSINVSIGVLFAIIFHLVFWPRYAQSDARNFLGTAFKNGSRLFSIFHRRYFAYGANARQECRVNINLADGEPTRIESRKAVPTASDDHQNLMDSIYSQDVMNNCNELNQRVCSQVASYVSEAILLLGSDASAWPGRSRRLALSSVLRDIPNCFISVQVCLAEMASVLGRRPIYEGRYSNSVHRLYIEPLIYEYETVLVSLHNLVSVTVECVFNKPRDLNLNDLHESLEEAIKHLTTSLRYLQVRIGEQRRKAQAGRLQEDKLFVVDAETPKHTLRYSQSLTSIPHAAGSGEKICQKSPSRRNSLELSSIRRSRVLLRVDDVVLYHAFSFSANACVEAFLAVARLVKKNMAAELEKMLQNKKVKSS